MGFTALVVGLSLIYPTLIETNLLSWLELSILVLIIGVNGALEFFTLARYRVLLTADQKIYMISIAMISNTVLNTFIVVGLAIWQVNIVLLKFIALTSILLRTIILSVYVRRKYPNIGFKEKPNTSALSRRWDAMYLQVLGATQQGAPVLLATVFTSLKWVSVYAVFNLVTSALQSVFSIFTNGLFASFGDIIASDEQNTLKKAYSEFEFSYYKLLAIAYTVASVTIMPFIALYTKNIVDINYNLPQIGFLMLLNSLLFNVKTPQGMLVMSAGLYKETRIQSTIQASIIIVFGIILASFFGLKGIIIASCASNLYRSIELFYFIPTNVTKLPVANTLKRVMMIFVEILVIAIPMTLIKIQVHSFLQWLTLAVGVGVLSIVITGVSALLTDKNTMVSVLNRIRLIMRKK